METEDAIAGKPAGLTTETNAEDSAPSILWPSADTIPALLAGEIHLWCWSLHGDKAEIFNAAQTLAEDERQRSERFAFQRDHRRYILAHAGMRRILGKYLELPAEKVEFTDVSGKPQIAKTSDVQFNLTHSANLAVLAISKELAVGVDLEFVDEEISALPLDQLPIHEQRELLGLPAESLVPTFFRYWTRREAVLKGVGTGLTGIAPSLANWNVELLFPADHYVGAVALSSKINRTHCFRWP